MAEYIIKETLQSKLNRKKAGPANKRYTEGWNGAILMVKSMIHGEKAADVAPVRHARWVDNHCTACGMMPMGDEMWKHLDLEPPLFERFMDYCPSCGCRMDG